MRGKKKTNVEQEEVRSFISGAFVRQANPNKKKARKKKRTLEIILREVGVGKSCPKKKRETLEDSKSKERENHKFSPCH